MKMFEYIKKVFYLCIIKLLLTFNITQMKARIYEKDGNESIIAESELFKYNHVELCEEAETLAKFADTFNLTAYITDVDCLKILKEIKVGDLYFEPQMLAVSPNTYDFSNNVSIEFKSEHYLERNKGKITICDYIFEIEQTSGQSNLELQWYLKELHRANIKAYELE